MITSRSTKYLLRGYILKDRLSKIYKSQNTISQSYARTISFAWVVQVY